MDAPTLILATLLATLLLIGVIFSMFSSRSRRRHEDKSLSAIDFARGSFASQLSHGIPMGELLLQLAEALSDTFKLDAAELWLLDGGRLTLVAAEPNDQRQAIAVTSAEQSIAANARVSSAAWAKVWLPELLDGRPNGNMRVAPISYSGQLFGLIVVERSPRANSLASEADTTLEEVAREVGVAVNKARLDAALQQSIEHLRQLPPRTKRGGASSATFTTVRSSVSWRLRSRRDSSNRRPEQTRTAPSSSSTSCRMTRRRRWMSCALSRTDCIRRCFRAPVSARRFPRRAVAHRWRQVSTSTGSVAFHLRLSPPCITAAWRRFRTRASTRAKERRPACASGRKTGNSGLRSATTERGSRSLMRWRARA